MTLQGIREVPSALAENPARSQGPCELRMADPRPRDSSQHAQRNQGAKGSPLSSPRWPRASWDAAG